MIPQALTVNPGFAYQMWHIGHTKMQNAQMWNVQTKTPHSRGNSGTGWDCLVSESILLVQFGALRNANMWQLSGINSASLPDTTSQAQMISYNWTCTLLLFVWQLFSKVSETTLGFVGRRSSVVLEDAVVLCIVVVTRGDLLICIAVLRNTPWFKNYTQIF